MTSQQFWGSRPIVASALIFAVLVEAATLVFALPGNCGIGYSFGMALVMCVVLYGGPALAAAGIAAAIGFLAPRMAYAWGVVALVMLAVIGIDCVVPHASCSILSGI